MESIIDIEKKKKNTKKLYKNIEKRHIKKEIFNPRLIFHQSDYFFVLKFKEKRLKKAVFRNLKIRVFHNPKSVEFENWRNKYSGI